MDGCMVERKVQNEGFMEKRWDSHTDTCLIIQPYVTLNCHISIVKLKTAPFTGFK